MHIPLNLSWQTRYQGQPHTQLMAEPAWTPPSTPPLGTESEAQLLLILIDIFREELADWYTD